MAFFLDPSAKHGLGDITLQALLECLDSKRQGGKLSLCGIPQREVSTKNGNRIDLLLEGDDWVVVLENKIYHEQINPFSDYEEYAQERFSNKTRHLVVLSPEGKASGGWLGISYKTVIGSISNRLAKAFIDQPLNKWLVFLREFILHLESLMGEETVDTETISFVMKNIGRIQQAQELKDQVVRSLQKECVKYLEKELGNGAVATKLHHWYGYPALRFNLDHWKTQSDVVLYLSGDESEGFLIQYYACDVVEGEREKALEMLKCGSTENWLELNNTVLAFKTPLNSNDKEHMFQEVYEKLVLLDKYESDRWIQLDR